ncbi:membrane protein insertion efficiency factor YidD [Acidithiobacillus sp.]|uniref:membrane protein insertion efficiency factor YidD n=1 Tax=Acidithiobacillus sp. TaxID=1872118 RepID=UPI00262FBC7E|nr:membrane protein insertion efficiency factor YidD [Acidithiobacillus sp.]
MSARGVAVMVVRGYQYVVSPMLGHHCRFYPTCSEYTCQAIERYGIAKGSWLGIKRISRCHPWQPGGVDPVP